MNRNNGVLAGAIAVLSASVAPAQVGTTALPVAPTALPPVAAPTSNVILTSTAPNVLRAGTPIALRMAEGLTTEKKKLRTGQRFQMEVAEALVVNGVTVIPAGSPATGEVTQIRNKGMWGKSGYIGAQALFVRANGRQIRLTGQFDDKGVTGTAGVVAAIALVPIAGFFTTGTSAKIPAGSGIKAFIDEDIAFAVDPSAAPTPMTVASPATAAATPAATTAPASSSVQANIATPQ